MRTILKNISWLNYLYNSFRICSLKLAGCSQGLDYKKLIDIVPDIEDHYTTTSLTTDYIKLKVRLMHAFQIDTVIHCPLTIFKVNNITDIGDSSGTHLTYIKWFFKQVNFRTLSVNINSEAVEKIKAKGMDAVQYDAEEYVKNKLYENTILLFETLEHFENPISFLKNLRKNSFANIIITVPYLKRSRVGLHHLRNKYHADTQGLLPEDVHIFELCPEDWKLIFNYCGWEVKYEKIYYQYPRNIPVISTLLKWYWRRMDFEGFYGVVLR